MKRILIFSTAYLPLIGGAEVAIRELTDRITDFEFDLICARLVPGLLARETVGRVNVYRVGFGCTFDKYLLPFLGPLRALFLKMDLLWSVQASYSGFAALFYSWLKPRTRFLLTLQEGDPFEHYAKRLGIFRGLHRAIFQRADAVQAISSYLCDWSLQMGFVGTPRLVPNGVDLENFSRPISSTRRHELRALFGFLENNVVLVTASRLTLKNAVDDLVRALVMLPSHIKLLVIGVGEDEAMLRALTEQLGVKDRVVFAGYRSHQELPELLRASDVFIRPSLSEGLGNAFLEAMASEIPVIGTPVGGIPDFLIDGETGVFCEPRDPESIAAAVERLLADPVLRLRIVKNSVKIVRERYDWGLISKKMNHLLIKL